jgi:pyridinium-3,5-biscarboxylic acid mononucleotide synthase
MQSTHEILLKVRRGSISISEAEKLLKLDALAIVGEIARLDINRYFRRGVPEIIYAASKSLDQIKAILKSAIQNKSKTHSLDSLPIIVSKLSEKQFRYLRPSLIEELREIDKSDELKYYPEGGILSIFGPVNKRNTINQVDRGRVALLSAGTSDIPALNEAEIILKLLSCKTLRFNDVGVAALHRLKDPMKKIQSFDPDVLIVAAGMEAALPSVVASLSSVPIIGLPTSVGFGFGGRGEAALMSMLQACPLGICTVNIDGGVAAGVIASLIARRCGESRTRKH